MIDLITANRALIEQRCRDRFFQRSMPLPTEEELREGIPLLIDQLIETLRYGKDVMHESEVESAAARYGGQLFGLGFTVSQLVEAYGALCSTVMELGQQLDAQFSVHDFELLNRILDVAIAAAVSEHERRQSEAVADRGAEDLGALAHELRNALAAAAIAFKLIKKGEVGAQGRTADIVDRSLIRMERLIDRALTEVRLQAGSAPVFERLRLVDVIDQLAAIMQREAENRGQTLHLEVEHELEIDADREFLASAVSNLVQNALKHTPAGGRVTVRGHGTDGHLLIEVEDECGGLPPGISEELFHPFVRRTSARPGLGLGLSIVMRAAKKLGGGVSVRDLPGKGCIFTLELPRALPAERQEPAHF